MNEYKVWYEYSNGSYKNRNYLWIDADDETQARAKVTEWANKFELPHFTIELVTQA